jgi:hypothetical protein
MAEPASVDRAIRNGRVGDRRHAPRVGEIDDNDSFDFAHERGNLRKTATARLRAGATGVTPFPHAQG